MRSFNSIFILLLISTLNLAQNADHKIEWNGYGQFRIYKLNNLSEGFMIRRTKLWVKGSVPKIDIMYYKVMGIFTYNRSGFFGLLDAYGEYRLGDGYLRFGQQIPEFSLQREQPDWKIPRVERASVINRLIPAAQSFARDIGVQIHLQPVKNVWQIAAGVFNGDGANLKKHDSANFLYSARSTAKINFAKNYSLHIGGSVSYRYALDQDFFLIFGRDNLFTGDDFRYGIESLLKLDKLELQAEYLEAHLGNKKAYGYYAYLNYNFSKKDQAIISFEQLSDLNENTDDSPWLIAGYNHLFASHKIKLMVSGGKQFNDNNNFSLTTQLQIFFN
jgi:phosphate-selective porin